MTYYSNTCLSNSELRIINNRLRRHRELRNHIIIFILSICLFITLAVVFFSTKSVASVSPENRLYKYYDSICIESGVTLYDLSLKYSDDSDDFIKEVMFINNLDEPDDIIAGNYIIVPYYDVLQQ